MQRTVSVLKTIHEQGIQPPIAGVDIKTLINSCSIREIIFYNFYKFLYLHNDYKIENFPRLIAYTMMGKNRNMETILRMDASLVGLVIQSTDVEKFFDINYLIYTRRYDLIQCHKQFQPNNYLGLIEIALKYNRKSVAVFIFNQASLSDMPIDIVELFIRIGFSNNLVINLAARDATQIIYLYNYAIKTDNEKLFIQLFYIHANYKKARQFLGNKSIIKQIYLVNMMLHNVYSYVLLALYFLIPPLVVYLNYISYFKCTPCQNISLNVFGLITWLFLSISLICIRPKERSSFNLQSDSGK